MSSDDTPGWHLDKKVPISILALLAAQFLGGLWYIAELRRDIELLKMGQTYATERDTRQDRVLTESMNLLRGDIQELKAKIDRLVESKTGNGR